MARKFMYVCIGIFALMGAFHLGAQYGHANYVDHTAAGVVAAEIDFSGDAALLMDDGEVWGWNEGNLEWSQLIPPPRPPSEIKFWDHRTLIDIDDQVWHEIGGQWFNRGAPPGGALTERSTWGKIKAKWQENE